MNKRLVANFAEVIIGLIMAVCGHIGIIDEYWSGMGTALAIVGAIMLIRQHRYKTNEEYKQKVDVEVNDERNKFLRIKAWAWAGYLFVLIGAVGSIVFRIVGKDVYSVFAGCSVCLIMVLYWVCYLILKRKY